MIGPGVRAPRRAVIAIAALVVIAAIVATGCRGHDHGPGGHDHDHGHAGGDREPPAQAVTIWTERSELFMEYAPLVVGRESAFAAHVTALPSFSPVTAGSATITIKYADGTAASARALAPANPGIFRPALSPVRAGACELTFSIESPQVTETLVAGSCTVYADEAAARGAVGDAADPPGRIAFLKEQQWKTEFATSRAARRDLQDGVRATGEIRPVAGREARVAAPVSGRVELATPVPLLGVAVSEGALLATIAPRLGGGADRSSLAAEVAALSAEVAAARSELARAQRLVADQAAPARSVDEARTRVQVAEARLAGATGRLTQYDASAVGGGGGRRFQMRAPIDGVLVSLEVATGQVVEEGQPMFDVIDLARVWLVARVFEPDIPRVEQARTAWFTIDGYDEPFTVDETNARLVTVGRVIDPKTRTVPVIFDLDNRAGRLRIGNYTRVVIATGAPRSALAIPETAVVDDAGRTVAYVMVEGEAFERRPLRLGIRSHGMVEVLDGIAEGERVVTEGAYEIRLAAAAGVAPAHGHAH